MSGSSAVDRVADGSDDAEIERASIAERGRADVDLRDARILRVELAIREVRPEQQQRVAVLHRPVSGGEPEESRHADIERIVVFDVLLAAQRVHDRRFQLAGKLDHLVMRTGAAGSAKQRDAAAAIQQIGQAVQLVIVRSYDRFRRQQPRWDRLGQWTQRHVARNDDDGYALLPDRDAHGAHQHLRQLIRVAHQLDVMTALLEQMLGMRRLEIVGADLGARDVSGDRQHGHAVAMGVDTGR